MRVKELWRYPVKSMAGEWLTSCGGTSDRVSMATDDGVLSISEPATSSRLAGSTRLLFAQARCLSAQEVEIILPGGRRANDDDALSAWRRWRSHAAHDDWPAT